MYNKISYYTMILIVISLSKINNIVVSGGVGDNF